MENKAKIIAGVGAGILFLACIFFLAQALVSSMDSSSGTTKATAKKRDYKRPFERNRGRNRNRDTERGRQAEEERRLAGTGEQSNENSNSGESATRGTASDLSSSALSGLPSGDEDGTEVKEPEPEAYTSETREEEERKKPKRKPKMPQVETPSEDIRKFRVGDKGESMLQYEGFDIDESGDTILHVEIDILSDECSWKCGSSERMFRANTEVPIKELRGIIRNLDKYQHFDDAQSIICVGTASSEGNPIREERRSEARAKRLKGLLGVYLKNKEMPIYAMRFGKHNEKISDRGCTNATLNQRRIILVKTIKEKDGLTTKGMEASLKKIFSRKSIDLNTSFPVDIRKYSLFENEKQMLLAL